MNKRTKKFCDSVLGAQLALAICLFVSPAIADWPFQRGDATGSGALAERFPEQPDELWRFEAEDSGFEATPVIVAGKVYLGDFDGSFYALDFESGQVVWKKKFEDSGFLSAVAVVDDRVYVGDFNGMFRCLNASDGQLLWKYEAKGEMYAGPNVYEGQVLVTTEAGELLALDATTGELLWEFQIEAPLRCWPSVVEGQVLLAGCDSRLHAIELDSGTEVGGLDLRGQTGTTPVRWQQSVLFGTATGAFYRVADLEVQWMNQDGRQQQIYSAATDGEIVVYTNKGKQIIAVDPKSGDTVWKAAVRGPLESAPVIAGEQVVVGTKRGKLLSFDLKTGKQRWEFEAGGEFLAPGALSDGKLVIANTDGTVYCFGADNGQ